MKDYLLSIIIPVYNVEDYIYYCLSSILHQEIDEKCYEIILIDDGCTDHSMEVISDILKEHSNIQILKQNNQGPSAARNSGIKAAKGEYILYVDSDDFLVENSLKFLLDITLKEKPDLIVADYLVKMEEDKLPINVERCSKPSIIEKNGHDLFMEDLDPEECYIWRTIYNKSYLEKIGLTFIEGISFEDIPYLQECYIRAEKCIRVYYPFYIYRRRHGTLSSTINEKLIYDMNKSLAKTWELSLRKDFPLKIREKLRDNLFASFSKNIWYISNNKKLLQNRKNYITDLKERIPSLSFNHGLKQYIVSWFYNVMPCTYIKIRSYF